MFYHIEKDKKKDYASIINVNTECVPLTISFHLYFLRISRVWSMLHHGSMGQVQSKECYFMFRYTFVTFFVVFYQKVCIFIIFVSFSDEVSNFRKKILSSLKPELMIMNCLWKVELYA